MQLPLFSSPLNDATICPKVLFAVIAHFFDDVCNSILIVCAELWKPKWGRREHLRNKLTFVVQN